jgi:long-chain acyl-CoA synthetase
VLAPEKSLDEKAVRAHCKGHLEEYKIPHIIAFVPEIPKTQGGKIRRV